MNLAEFLSAALAGAVTGLTIELYRSYKRAEELRYKLANERLRVAEYAKAGLWDYVCFLSEQYWAATYQQGLMAAIKKAVTDPAADRRVWNRTQLSEAEVATLRKLADDAGEWPEEGEN